MKADVFVAKTTMHDSGNQMLAGMLLHKHKTAFPVDFARYGFANREGRVTKMNNLAIAFKNIENADGVDRAQIAGLTAAGRIEDGFI